MYTVEERRALRSALLEHASLDPQIASAALTGSAAADREDEWSDIDLAFGVADAADVADSLAHWTAIMYDRHHAVHHVDVKAGAWIYRVFLIQNGLQVDLAFVPVSEFRALAPSFRLVFGEARNPGSFPSPRADDLIGMAWLYALHARSSIARGKPWQAEYMISGVRDHALALACIRHGLPAVHGRGVDQLPAAVTGRFEAALVRSVDSEELLRAFECAVAEFLAEVQSRDPALAVRLSSALGNTRRYKMGRMSKGYWVTTYRSISDPAALQEYAKLAGPALTAAGGKMIVRTSENIEPHESGLPERVVVIEFESVEKARAAYNSPEYQKAKAVLGNGAVRDVRIVSGVE
jgi:uncharacterized protein (DUF1330 family)